MARVLGSAAAAAFGVFVALAGCDSDGGGAGDGGTGGTGGTGGGSGGTAVQLLTFTGAIAGNMLEATTDCYRSSTTPPALTVDLRGAVAGTQRRLKFTIQNYAGPGNYGGGALRVEIEGTMAAGDEASVAAGEKSGTIESATNTDGNRVSGSWNCATAPATR